MQQDKNGAVWGTITMAMPQLIEWQIEGGENRLEAQPQGVPGCLGNSQRGA
ncbi:hypothetical protein SAMN04489859_1008137 [Paracoccus alcaliphilus]|uniref:Uncharacterized protein n=1 Tax=Paracoccus alcaliphilus TaxID=34002 RepID=A0A1H8H800_9RHOB|nr:hypothetical protein [Paracoccus alcaliphilus]WCR17355.1 hypothetical protein JHW40_13540 [Paracoccus alcaliphilus]SEN51658.1 hypothetical protein SAMN04489859_1008137 [Paracoccus alcaliphilus]